MSDEIGLDIKKALSKKIAMEMSSFLEDKYKNEILIDQNNQFNISFFDMMTDVFLAIFYELSENKDKKQNTKIKKANSNGKNKR